MEHVGFQKYVISLETGALPIPILVGEIYFMEWLKPFLQERVITNKK